MRRSFSESYAAAPAILFIDEVDSFPNRSTVRHDHADWEVQVVNALLAEIDGVDSREGVVLVAACNHPDMLDPALVRSGRLDRRLHIGLPDRAALVRIFREHLDPDLADADLSTLALAATGASGADCERWVRGARRRARAAGRAVALGDLFEEIGLACRAAPADEWLAAVHEAGHVVATAVLRPGATSMVSLAAGTEQGGQTVSTRAGPRYLRGPDLEARLQTLLAGRAAEELEFGSPSSGAGGTADSDLAQATELLTNAEAVFGLGRSGLLWRGGAAIGHAQDFLAADRELAGYVRAGLDGAYVAARGLLASRMDAVHAVAGALVARRVLDGPEAEAIALRPSQRSQA